MEDIIIKVRENEDRSVIFGFPNNSIDLKLDVNSLREGRIQVSWELRDLKKAIKENKDGKINNKNEK